MLSLVKTFLFSVLKQRTNEYLGGKKREKEEWGKKELREHTDLCVFVWNNICSGTHKSYAQH